MRDEEENPRERRHQPRVSVSRPMPRVEKLYGREWTTFSSCSKMWRGEVEWMRENEEEGRKKAYAKNTFAIKWEVGRLSDSFPKYSLAQVQSNNGNCRKKVPVHTNTFKDRSGETESCRVAWWSTLSLSEVLETRRFPFFRRHLSDNSHSEVKIQRKYFLYTVEGVNGFLSIPHLVQRELTTAFVLFLIHSGCILGELKHEIEIFLKISQATH